MAARIYSQFPEKKISGPAASKTSDPGGKKATWNGSEKTADWPSAGPAWKGSFNRSTRFDVVKQYAKKQGID